MLKYLNLVVVLSVIATVSGLALGGLNELTWERIDNNVLKYKKIPAVADIQEGVQGRMSEERRLALEAELLAGKRYLEREGDEPLLYFVVRDGEKPHAVTLEGFGQGFGGDLGVMVGFQLDSGDLAGIGITTLSETPGLGTHVQDAVFRKQFVGMGKDAVFKVKKDKGDIDAVTGATISSRAVAQAITEASATFALHRERIVAAIAAGGEGSP